MGGYRGHWALRSDVGTFVRKRTEGAQKLHHRHLGIHIERYSGALSQLPPVTVKACPARTSVNDFGRLMVTFSK